MNSRALLVALFCVVFAGSAGAQFQEPGDVGIYADEFATSYSLAVVPFVPTNLFITSFDLPEFNAYEVGVAGLLENGANILGDDLFGPAPLDFGSPGNYIVGTGGCVDGGGALTLVTLQVIFLGSPDLDTLISVSGVTPSSFASGAPGYNTCDGQLVEFGLAPSPCLGVYPDGTLVLNPSMDCPVSGAETSFGALKSRF